MASRRTRRQNATCGRTVGRRRGRLQSKPSVGEVASRCQISRRRAFDRASRRHARGTALGAGAARARAQRAAAVLRAVRGARRRCAGVRRRARAALPRIAAACPVCALPAAGGERLRPLPRASAAVRGDDRRVRLRLPGRSPAAAVQVPAGGSRSPSGRPARSRRRGAARTGAAARPTDCVVALPLARHASASAASTRRTRSRGASRRARACR